MKQMNLFALLAVAGAALLLTTSCSSSHSPTTPANMGAVKMTMKASGTVAAATTAAATSSGKGVAPADMSNGPTAANIVISGASAQLTDGTFVPVTATFPQTIDQLALATSGGSVTLPAGLLPDGSYTALQITITQASITLHDGTIVTITPPGTGWLVLIPVTFDVVAGQETQITLNLRCDHSFHFLNGEFEFDPDIEVEGVEQHHHD
jgi:hypothetical protein